MAEASDAMVFAAGNQIWNRGWQVPFEVLRFGIEAALNARPKPEAVDFAPPYDR